MITLSITVKNRVADWTPSAALPQIYAGSTNVDKVRFILDSEWNSFTNKKAWLSDGDEVWEVALDSQGYASIPAQITEKPCFMEIAVTGRTTTGQTISSSLLFYQIGRGGSVQTFYEGSELKSLTEKVNIALEMKVLGEVEAQYYLSNKATITTNVSWSTTPQAPTTSMPYLWQRFKFCYVNGEASYTQPAVICAKGDKGDTGATGAKGADGKNGVEPEEVQAIQTNISTLQSNVSTAQGNISTLQGNVSTLQTNVSSLQTTTSGLQTTLNGMQKIKSVGTGLSVNAAGQLNLTTTVKVIKTGTAEPTTSLISDGQVYLQLPA